jgi:hypothetical protein
MNTAMTLPYHKVPHLWRFRRRSAALRPPRSTAFDFVRGLTTALAWAAEFAIAAKALRNSVPHPGNSGVGRFCDCDFDLWSERELCGVIPGKVGPNHVFIVEAARERGLHYHEVG